MGWARTRRIREQRLSEYSDSVKKMKVPPRSLPVSVSFPFLCLATHLLGDMFGQSPTAEMTGRSMGGKYRIFGRSFRVLALIRCVKLESLPALSRQPVVRAASSPFFKSDRAPPAAARKEQNKRATSHEKGNFPL